MKKVNTSRSAINMGIDFKCVSAFLIWIKLVVSITPNKNIMYSVDGSIADIADFIASKGYIPNEKELPSAPLIKNNDNDATYLLTKLSDEELLKLLNEQPQKNEYDINDIMRIAFDTKTGRENRIQPSRELTQKRNPNVLGDSSVEKKRFRTVTNNDPLAYYRLNNKPVNAYRGPNDANYIAYQKLKNLLSVYSQPKPEETNDDNDEKKLIFDILVDQLKTLCCKGSKNTNTIKGQYKTLIEEILPSLLKHKINGPNRVSSPVDYNKDNEFMFLIINDEIKSNGSDELIDVDPESLDSNSSVLLLGPVTSTLTDDQLKLVMNRISNELIKPEYISFLQQLSNGVRNNNKKIMKDFIFGPQTRRYIKPHRCNHQSKLAKVYGGPKWIVCTGYLNLNKPSLYD